MSDRAFCFICGCQRSGTTLMSSMLSVVDGVSLMPETHWYILCQDGKLPIEEIDSYLSNVRDYNSYWLEEPAQYERLADCLENLTESNNSGFVTFTDLIEEWCDGDAEIIGEKTPTHLFYWRDLAKLNGSSKFIVMLRDARGAAFSEKAKVDKLEGRNYSDRKFSIKWLVSLYLLNGMRKSHPERVKIVQLENIVEDRRGVMIEICEFLGVRYSPSLESVGIVNSSFESASSQSTKMRWSDDFDFSEYFRWVLGPELREAGYEVTLGGARPFQYLVERWVVLVVSRIIYFFPKLGYRILRKKTRSV